MPFSVYDQPYSVKRLVKTLLINFSMVVAFAMMDVSAYQFVIIYSLGITIGMLKVVSELALFLKNEYRSGCFPAISSTLTFLSAIVLCLLPLLIFGVLFNKKIGSLINQMENLADKPSVTITLFTFIVISIYNMIKAYKPPQNLRAFHNNYWYLLAYFFGLVLLLGFSYFMLPIIATELEFPLLFVILFSFIKASIDFLFPILFTFRVL